MGVLTHLSKTIFPPAVNDNILWAIVGWDAMAGFKGRQEQNAIFKTEDAKKQN